MLVNWCHYVTKKGHFFSISSYIFRLKNLPILKEQTFEVQKILNSFYLYSYVTVLISWNYRMDVLQLIRFCNSAYNRFYEKKKRCLVYEYKKFIKRFEH